MTVMCWSHAHNDLQHKTFSQCLNRSAAVNGLKRKGEEHERSHDSHVMTHRGKGVESHILQRNNPVLRFVLRLCSQEISCLLTMQSEGIPSCMTNKHTHMYIVSKGSPEPVSFTLSSS